MDCRHPDPQDASGDIHVNLGSGYPCRNDGIYKISSKVELKNCTTTGLATIFEA
jgi:hypothetical protein